MLLKYVDTTVNTVVISLFVNADTIATTLYPYLLNVCVIPSSILHPMTVSSVKCKHPGHQAAPRSVKNLILVKIQKRFVRFNVSTLFVSWGKCPGILTIVTSIIHDCPFTSLIEALLTMLLCFLPFLYDWEIKAWQNAWKKRQYLTEVVAKSYKHCIEICKNEFVLARNLW